MKLEKYCTDISLINGIETFIISPEKYDDFAGDEELLEEIKTTKDRILPFIKSAKEIACDKIYFSIAHLPAKFDWLQWLPALCYKDGEQFIHVAYRTIWICIECGNALEKQILMPINEAEPIFKAYCENKHPDTPPMFQKVKCPVCGSLLQNHLYIID